LSDQPGGAICCGEGQGIPRGIGERGNRSAGECAPDRDCVAIDRSSWNDPHGSHARGAHHGRSGELQEIPARAGTRLSVVVRLDEPSKALKLRLLSVKALHQHVHI
jgi:hypothetical protein